MGLMLKSVVMALGPGSTGARQVQGTNGVSLAPKSSRANLMLGPAQNLVLQTPGRAWSLGCDESLLITWISGWSGTGVCQGPVAGVSQKCGSLVVGLKLGPARSLGLQVPARQFRISEVSMA